MDKLIWYVKQLLPLTYRTQYVEKSETHFCVWRMWFGRCFDIYDVAISRTTHTTEEDFQHFLSYSGFRGDEENLRSAYFAGAGR